MANFWRAFLLNGRLNRDRLWFEWMAVTANIYSLKRPDGAGSIKLGKCSTLILLSFNEQAEK
jgi:hypothetical protein